MVFSINNKELLKFQDFHQVFLIPLTFPQLKLHGEMERLIMKNAQLAVTIIDKVRGAAACHAQTLAEHQHPTTRIQEQIAILTGLNCKAEDISTSGGLNKLIKIAEQNLKSEQKKSAGLKPFYNFHRHVELHKLLKCLKEKRSKFHTCCADKEPD